VALVTRDQWLVALAMAVALFLVWRNVRRREAAAAAHMQQVSNARAMTGIVGTIVSYFTGA